MWFCGSVMCVHHSPSNIFVKMVLQEQQELTALENKNVWLHLQLQEVFTSYKKERVECDKGLTEQNEKLQEQLSDLRSQNAKISTQLEFASKR